MSISEAFYEFMRCAYELDDLNPKADELWRRVIIAGFRDLQPPKKRVVRDWLKSEGLHPMRAEARADEYAEGIKLLRMYDPPKYTFTEDINE
jgi:hypothetical protein